MSYIAIFLTWVALFCLTSGSLADEDNQGNNYTMARIESATLDLAGELNSNITAIDSSSVYDLLEKHLDRNPEVFGAAFAFAPFERNGQMVKAAYYVYRDGEVIKRKDIAEDYDYSSDPWYAEPVRLGDAVWSEPYYDEAGAGADMLMTTYSVPVYNGEGILIGVLTGDLLIKKGEQIIE
jgi:hypothetical protein